MPHLKPPALQLEATTTVDMPVFHLESVSNHWLIALFAITHGIVNHSLAFGACAWITAIEWQSSPRKDLPWDRLAARLLRVLVLTLSSLGVLAGIGFWFLSALLSPADVGSVLRYSFWSSLSGLSLYIIQFLLIIAYLATWNRWQGRAKRWHIALGMISTLFAWITLAIRLTNDGLMVSNQLAPQSSSLSAVLSPIWAPQFVFQTCLAVTIGGLFVWLLTAWLAQPNSACKISIVPWLTTWMIPLTLLCLVAVGWYWRNLPTYAISQDAVGVLTDQFAQWRTQLLIGAAVAIAVMSLVVLWGRLRSNAVPGLAILFALLLAAGVAGHASRASEFLRKPYLIEGYMYSNGVRVEELALLQHEGILPHSVYSPSQPITDANRVEAGQRVFWLTCTRCHTANGLDGVAGKLERLYGKDPWDSKQVEALLASMQNTRAYMPPFPGNAEESRALAAYLCELQKAR